MAAKLIAGLSAKDFAALASAVADMRAALPSYPEHLHGHTRQISVIDSYSRTLADVLATTNPKFNRTKFLTQCGVK